MIIIEGFVRLAAGDVEKFLAAAIEMARESRKESTNLEYAFSRDLSDPGLVRVIERWESEDALAKHFATPHMATFRATLSAVKIEEGSVNVYSAEFVRKMI